ncbi:MAG TPA: serine protease [Gemmatimonadaceae bacterium]|nr:serine protease [Gemmatimonadaceae bacterium]
MSFARPLLLAALLLWTGDLVAQARSIATSDVFSRYADRVVKIQVVETGSAAKATIGSGFFVSGSGHLVTNYHVISKLIHDPDRYRAELIDVAGTVEPVEVLGVDVVHDLAVLGSALRPRAHFALGSSRIAQGNRLYSLGHPEDLGLSIVEGTYNGLLPHTRHPRIHFTGSLNPGMSGGPTIAEDGRVVGVNVATAGNQLSFLVPVDRAETLLDRVLTPGDEPPARTLEEVGRQLRDHQDAYLRDMFAGNTKMVDLGPYRLVTEPAPFFRCWADASRRQELPYEKVQHHCSTDDYLFIAGDQSTGVIDVEHEMISTKKLNASQFFSLYSSVFANDNTPSGQEEHVTSWACGTRNVRNASLPMRAVLCLRRYRKLGELYDGVLKVAVLGRDDSGLVSTLTMSGVTFENVDRLARRYLERISWR